MNALCSNGNRSTGRGTAKRDRSSPGQVLLQKLLRMRQSLKNPSTCAYYDSATTVLSLFDFLWE